MLRAVAAPYLASDLTRFPRDFMRLSSGSDATSVVID